MTDKPASAPSMYSTKYIVVENLSSKFFNKSNPPQDWADVSLLVPHEAIRREEQRMLQSVNKLAELSETNCVQSWQPLYFSEWFLDIFSAFVRSHHDTEEEIYFPWLQTKAEIPKKQLAEDHAGLILQLDQLEGLCKDIVRKQGINCDAEISALKDKIHSFVSHMDEHLMEEERDIPPIARKYFSEKEEAKVVATIARKGGLKEFRNGFPCILEAMKEWGTPAQVAKVDAFLPALLKYLGNNFCLPDYETCVKPKRDAPLLATEPLLDRVGCCGLSFCCTCII